MPHAIGLRAGKGRPTVDALVQPLQGFSAGPDEEKRMRLPYRLALLGLAAIVAAVPSKRAAADAVADFYRGKTVNVIVGYTAGGGYDLYARALARHMGKH